MARFVFKLEALLELRRREERDRQAQLAVIEAKRLEFEHAITTNQHELNEIRRDVRGVLQPGHDSGAGEAVGGAGHEAGGSTVDLRSIRRQASRSLHVRGRTHQLVLQLAGVHHRLEAARTVLREASTRRRAVEMLRERQYQRWLAEQNRREAIALDELATMRYARTTAAGASVKDVAGDDPINR